MNYVMTKPGAMEPRYGSEGAAGIDIYYNGEDPVRIKRRGRGFKEGAGLHRAAGGFGRRAGG